MNRLDEAIIDRAEGCMLGQLAGQPTNDSEMALLLARSLVKRGKYDAPTVRKEYQWWVDSGPFDMGNAIYCSAQFMVAHPFRKHGS